MGDIHIQLIDVAVTFMVLSGYKMGVSIREGESVLDKGEPVKDLEDPPESMRGMVGRPP